MKYIISIFVLIISINCFSQFGFPRALPGNNEPHITVNQGTIGTTTGFTFVTNFADTTAANSVLYLKDQPGILILIGKSELWMRNTPPNKWILIGGSAVDNNQWFGIDAFATFKNGTLTTGTQNLAIGQNALKLNIAGIGNTATGFNTLSNNNGNYNTALGYISLRQNLIGINNTGLGSSSLLNNTSGYNNTATGFNSLTTLTTSANNTANGYNSLSALTTGASNTSIGSNSMLSSGIASWNVAVGDSALFANVSGHGNVGIGYQVGSNTGGDFNIFIGWQAGNNASQKATPIRTITIGDRAYNTTDTSIAIGLNATTTLSKQIIIGSSSYTDFRAYGIAPGEGTAVLKYDTVSKQFFYGSPAGVAANNGITDSSGRFVLGGPLYKATFINTNSYQLNVSTSESGIIPLQVSSTDNHAILGMSVDATGIAGVSTNGFGVEGGSTTSYGGFFQSAGAIAGIISQTFGGDANTITPVLELYRVNSNTPAAGMGQSIDFYSYVSNFTKRQMNQIISEMTNATDGTRSSQLYITGVSNAVTQYYANFQTAGIVRVNNLADTLSTKAYVRQFNASLGSTIYTADDALVSDRTVDVDGNFLKVSNSGFDFLLIDPTVDAEQAALQAFNNTDDGNFGQFRATTSESSVNSIVIADFNDGVRRAKLNLFADATQSTALVQADVFTLNSSFEIADASLGSAVNGYVWTLVDFTTGEGAWVVSSGGGGGSVNSVNVAGGTTGLTFSGGPVTTTGTITMAGTLGVANGGTNITSYAVGDLIYASGATTLSKLADVAAGSYLRSGGVTTAPVWSTLILPNSATVNQIVFATSTNTYGGNANLTFDGNILTLSSGVTTGTTTTSAFVGTFNSVTSGTGMYLAGSGSTSGNYLQIISTGTAKTANNEALDIQVSGANATNGITTTGGRVSVLNTNATSGTNIAFATRASGATTLNLDLDMGIAGTAGGHMRINGLTSGGVILQTANAAGTWTLTLPTDDGANSYDYLATDGSGVTRWQAGFNPTWQTLTDGTSITWNVNNGGNAKVTLGAAGRTVSITNPVDGHTYTLRVIQGGAGSTTITTWPTGTKWPNNGTAPTLTTTVGRYDIITFTYEAATSSFYGNYNFNYQ